MSNTKKSLTAQDIGRYLLDHTLVVILVLLAVITAIARPTFLSVGNLTNIMRQFGALSFIALGLTFAIIAGFIDLSIPGMVNMAAVLVIWFVNPVGQWGSLILTIGFGVLAGFINGFLITRAGAITQAEGLFISFGMSQVWSAAALILSDGKTQQFRWTERPYDIFVWLGSFKIGFIPIAIVIFVIAMLILNFVHKRTYFGRCVSLIGGNKTAANLSGINVNWTIIRTFMVAGAMTAIGAIMLVSRVTNASPTVGSGYDNDAILSVVVGGTSLSGGKGSVIGTMLGVLLVTLLSNCMNLLEISPYMQYVVKGAVLIFAIWADSRKNREVK
jgi:ribose transport system permease protein